MFAPPSPVQPAVLSLIGNTPLVPLRFTPEGLTVFAKAEFLNPSGSIKDRLALTILGDAVERGLLGPDSVVLECTSGNTGISLAMVGAALGLRVKILMSDTASIERRHLMRHFGAELELFHTDRGYITGIELSREMAARDPRYFLPRQFENDLNAVDHERHTAVEILRQLDGRIDAFVTGYGTGGTLKGAARVLRERSPATRIVACEPDNSPLLASGIAQARRADGAAADSHPAFRPHLMQGWTPDFISRLTEDAMAAGLVDRIVAVNGNDALACARDLARREGIFTGISGGATFAAALAVAREAPAGSTILCMLPDTGERYLSTPLFDAIGADMDEDELAISRSTPGGRFDSPAPVAPAATPIAPAAAPIDAAAARAVNELLADAAQPVVMFALEWCEFCWAVRKLFAALGIPLRSVDLDSVAYQQDNLGGRMRPVLAERTGSRTIPQVFVGGRPIGGCMDTFAAYRDGRLKALLAPYGITPNRDDLDPAAFLPKWIHRQRGDERAAA